MQPSAANWGLARVEGRGALHVLFLTALTVIKGLLWIGLIPLFLVADEPAHFDNVQHRAEHHAAPQRDPKKTIPKVMHDGASPEVKLLWNSTLHKDYYRRPHDAQLPDKLAALAQTDAGRDTDGQAPAIDYPGLYYEAAVPFYRHFSTSSLVTRIAAVRFLSLLFGLCAVLATYFAARLVVDDPILALVAAVVVALQPMESQQTASVNNDAGVIGFGALLFYFQLRALSALPKMPGVGTLLGLFASAGALVATKPTGYGLLPGIGVVLLAVAFTHRRDRRMQVACGAAALLGIGVVAHLEHTGRPLASFLPGDTANPGQYGHENFLLFLDSLDKSYLDYLLRSTWGQFGWLDYSMNMLWLPHLRAVYWLTLVGTVVAIATYTLRRLDQPFWHRGPLLWFSIGTVVTGVSFILYVEHRYRLTGIVGVIQGRNFLFALPAFAIWMVVALCALVPKRMRGTSAAMIFTGALLLQATGVLTVLRHHYVR